MRLLRRYAQPKRGNEVQTVVVAGDHHVAYKGHVYDLRTGARLEKSRGARFGRDGAWIEWMKDGTLHLRTAAGSSTQLTGHEGLSTLVLAVGDEQVLLQADGRQPLLCIERATGQPAGRFEGLQGELYGTTRLFNVALFDPRDGRTVWINDAGRLAQFELATRQALRWLEAAEAEKFLGVTANAEGWVMTTARKRALGFDTSQDEVVLFAPDGSSRRAKRTVMSMAPLVNGFVCFEPEKRQFVVFDLELREVETIAHDSNWVQLVALPSRREWISIGGKSEWDHHGEEALAPEEESPPPKKEKPQKK